MLTTIDGFLYNFIQLRWYRNLCISYWTKGIPSNSKIESEKWPAISKHLNVFTATSAQAFLAIIDPFTVGLDLIRKIATTFINAFECR